MAQDIETARRLIAEERANQTGFLDLGNLGLTELPEALFELTHLRRLNLSSFYENERGEIQQTSNSGPLNALTELPSSIADLRMLEVLTLVENPIQSVNALAGLATLKELDCSSTEISDLSSLSTLKALQRLDVSNTPVRTLAPLQTLANLETLDCWDCDITDLQPLAGLENLRELDCSSTEVRKWTPLQGLTKLKIDDLQPLQNLKKLKTFVCYGSAVSDLRPLGALTELQQLDVSDTQVRDLTPLIDLPNLTSLSANACQLDDLPHALVWSETLDDLWLYATTIPGIPQEVLSHGPFSNCLPTLRAHLKDLQAGAEPIREAKLVVLGNGRVGKTQLCRHLRGLPFDETIPSTHGITVTSERWGDGGDDDESETLNIWDFGGQDIYHGAHTLFMKTRAVFLIVWHPDFENSVEETVDGMCFRNYPLSYWLEYVRTLGREDCPVIVVQTRCERPEQEVHRLPVEDEFLKFPSLKQCWFSAQTGRGRGALQDALNDAVATLRARDGIATIGTGRMQVLQQLEHWRDADQTRPVSERQHRTLSQAEFHSLCEQTGGVSSPASLLAYLHNLGVVFHQPTLFQDRIILDQSWALEAVYGVFERSKAYPIICSQGGRFTPTLLAITVWQDYTDNERALFLSLMESCGIVFQHREANPCYGLDTEYLAPDLLMDQSAIAQQLAGRWSDTEKTWRLEYDYPFLHPGLMRALICDVGQKSADAGVYWKYGLWVFDQSTGCRAWLEQQMDNERRGRIVLKIQGPRHETLARWLRERIEERNRLFGYPCLTPVVDDFARYDDGGLKRVARMSARGDGQPDPEDGATPSKAEHAIPEPRFDKPPASFFPSEGPRVFVSYAWGDESAEGQRRQQLVETLCVSLGEQGVKVRRDQDELRPGELISEFMDRLAEGDIVLAVISDKYLKSEYCMYELFRIYRNCAERPERFLGRVIPLILPDARLDEIEDRFVRAIHWTDREHKLKPLIAGNVESAGTMLFRKFKLIGEFARNTSDMLELLIDKLQPRDFDRQAAEGFKEILAQIGTPPRAP